MTYTSTQWQATDECRYYRHSSVHGRQILRYILDKYKVHSFATIQISKTIPDDHVYGLTDALTSPLHSRWRHVDLSLNIETNTFQSYNMSSTRRQKISLTKKCHSHMQFLIGSSKFPRSIKKWNTHYNQSEVVNVMLNLRYN